MFSNRFSVLLLTVVITETLQMRCMMNIKSGWSISMTKQLIQVLITRTLLILLNANHCSLFTKLTYELKC